MAEAHAYQPPFPDPENGGREQVVPFHQQAAPAPQPVPSPDPGPAQPRSTRSDLSDLSVGEILRRERVRYGKTLEDVEAMLRIRIAYLEAIEQGDHSRLPGRVYAIGFVRSYAEYLGLDGAKIIAMFKRQATATNSGPSPELNFPVAASERRVASPWLFVSATVLAAAAVAVWVMSSKPVFPPADDIPPAPPGISTSATHPTAPASAETLAKIEPGTGTTEAEIRRQVAQVDPSIAVAPIETEASSEAQAQEITATSSFAPVVKTTAENLATPAAADVAAAAAAAAHRIVLKAVESTWIEIRDAQGTALLSSILKAGDIYFVPDQPGLVLSTGNAGGFEIELDGKAIGKLGETGDVRRDVALSPSALTGSLAPKTP